MQSNKTSKQTRKTAAESAAPLTAVTPNETTAKSRAARSSKSKSESAESSPVKHHHKATSPVAAAEELKAVSTAAAELPAPPPIATVAEFVTLAPAVAPTDEQIALHAHALWLERGCEHGYAEQDWLQAEQQLRAVQAST